MRAISLDLYAIHSAYNVLGVSGLEDLHFCHSMSLVETE